MTLEEVIRKLKSRNVSEISRDTGISRVAIQDIRSGKTTKPQYETVRKIVKWLEEN